MDVKENNGQMDGDIYMEQQENQKPQKILSPHTFPCKKKSGPPHLALFQKSAPSTPAEWEG